MNAIASVAESVLAPGLGSVLGPLVQGLAGPLEGVLGNAIGGIAGQVGGGLNNLISGFENAFLGPLSQLGQALQPPQGQFSPFPMPFPQPPYANNPLAPFQSGGGTGSGNPLSPANVANVGNIVDNMTADAMKKLQNPNATSADILQAQQEMQQANQLFSMISEMLKETNQNALKAIQNIG